MDSLIKLLRYLGVSLRADLTNKISQPKSKTSSSVSTTERQIVEHTRGKGTYWTIEFRVRHTEDWVCHYETYPSFKLAKEMYDMLCANDTKTRTVVYP